RDLHRLGHRLRSALPPAPDVRIPIPDPRDPGERDHRRLLRLASALSSRTLPDSDPRHGLRLLLQHRPRAVGGRRPVRRAAAEGVRRQLRADGQPHLPRLSAGPGRHLLLPRNEGQAAAGVAGMPNFPTSIWTTLLSLREDPERVRDLVVRRYRQPIYDFVRRQNLSHEDAEDLT